MDPAAHNLRSLSDDDLLDLATSWQDRAANGVHGAAQMAAAFEAEVQRRETGKSTFDPLLELPQPRPWWKFW